jgi:LacI family transcriptional regulator
MTERHRGYSDCLSAVGIPEDPALAPTESADQAGGTAAVLRLLKERPDVTALLCANTWAGLGAVHALHTAQRTDVAMISFGDFPLAGTLEPGVTCVDQDPRLIGEVAAEHLLSRLGLGAQPPTTDGDLPRRTVLPARLVERGSGEIEAPR